MSGGDFRCLITRIDQIRKTGYNNIEVININNMNEKDPISAKYDKLREDRRQRTQEQGRSEARLNREITELDIAEHQERISSKESQTIIDEITSRVGEASESPEDIDQMRSELLMKLKEDEIPPALQREALDFSIKYGDSIEEKLPHMTRGHLITYRLVECPNLTPEILHSITILRSGSEWQGGGIVIRKKVANHPNTSANTLDFLSRNMSTALRKAVIGNNNTSDDTLEAMMKDDPKEAIRKLAEAKLQERKSK